jgi:hypothetical protein
MTDVWVRGGKTARSGESEVEGAGKKGRSAGWVSSSLATWGPKPARATKR